MRPADRVPVGSLPTGRSLGATLLVLLSALLVRPAPAAGQQSDGFLFDRPNVTLGVYGGYALPGAGSEIFDFTRERLTVDEGDFRSATFGARLGVRITERFDLGLNLARAGAEKASEFRDWVDQDDRPIEQTTSLDRTTLTLDAKVYPFDRGRSIGRYVWIPRGVAPYVGAGGGIAWYDFVQEGDFVDFQTLDIFSDRFVSEGSTATWQAFAGVDVSLTPRVFATAEVRHGWASARMDGDFVGFGPIDLSGFQGSVGVSLRL